MARSIPVGGIHISITGNSVDFRKAVKSARSEIWKLKNAFAPLVSATRTAGLAVAAFGVSAAVMGKNLADGIDKLGKLSTSLRTSVADLQAFEMAAGLQGVDFTKATNGLKKLEVVVGQIASGRAYSEVTEEWDKLGLKIEDIIDLPIVEQFERITQAIRDFVPVGERAATASAFFGTRNAADVLRMTAETMEQSRDALREYGITLSQTAARDTEAMNDAMLVLSLIFKNFARNLVADHAPAIKAWVKQVQAGLKPGGKLRDMIERLATAFRLAAASAVEFVDIVSGVVTQEAATTAALAAILLAGTRIALMLGTATLALGRFAAAMITGQSIASGFAVVLGVLRGGVGGLITTMAALGLAVAGGMAVHRTLTAEFGAQAAAASSSGEIVDSLSAKYDDLKASMEGVSGATEEMTDATRRAMRADIERLRLKAMFEEAGVANSPEFSNRQAQISALMAKRRSLMAPDAVDVAVENAQGHMTAAQFIEGRREQVRGIDQQIADLREQNAAMLSNVQYMRDEADAFEARLREGVVDGLVKTGEDGVKTFTDLGEAARSAFEKMDKGFESWYDKYMEGMADAGDMLDQFGKDMLKYIARQWAFQPLMGGFGSLLGNVPGFADGGHHRGGARIVGEHGPELEVTGPSRIYSAADTRRMLAGGNSVDLNINISGNRDDQRDMVQAQIVEMAPQLAEMLVGKVAMEASRPSMLNSRIRGAR